MKTAIIFSDGMKQIILTPENDDEKFALSLLTVNDDMELAMHEGQFGERGFVPFTASINESKGGYLRVYKDGMSKIIVLKPKPTP